MAVVEAELDAHGACVCPWDLGTRPLPIADPAFHEDPTKLHEEPARTFVRLAQEADAFVLGCPVYHNSYTGVLKNALDTVAIAQFRDKPVGLASHGAHRNTQAVDHLRIVARGLLGIAIPTQVCTSEEDFASRESDYRLTSGEIAARVKRFAAELLTFAAIFRSLRRS
jgi:azobenzene reductase